MYKHFHKLDRIKDTIRLEILSRDLYGSIGKSFEYMYDKLKLKDYHLDYSDGCDLIEGNWHEGKSYYWIAVTVSENLMFLIRRYQTHFTVYTKQIKDDRKRYGSFTFYSNQSLNKKIREEEDWEFYYQNEAYDLNRYLPHIIKEMNENGVHFIDNPYSFKELLGDKPKFEHVEIHVIFDGRETIHSFDKYFYVCEELSSITSQFFAEIDMFEKIKTFKVGDLVGTYEITKVKTKLENDYYHGVGLELLEDGKKRWSDVYSLSTWYFSDIFPE